MRSLKRMNFMKMSSLRSEKQNFHANPCEQTHSKTIIDSISRSQENCKCHRVAHDRQLRVLSESIFG